MQNDSESGVPFAAETPDEDRLWQALGQLRQPSPSARLHRSFYRRLDRAAHPTLAQRLGGWLSHPWAPAMASLVIGLAVGLSLRPGPAVDTTELAQLRQQVSDLNRTVVLDMLAEESPGLRLRGVLTATPMAGSDPQVATALLARAASDRNASVRAAAIDALGPQLRDAAVGDALMALLPQVQSPLVQMALVDLVLRFGSATQMEQLLQLAQTGELHPDLVEHVRQSARRVSA